MPSYWPLSASASFKKITGPFSTIVLITSAAQTTINTELNDRQKWQHFLHTSRYECLTKKEAVDTILYDYSS